MKAPTSSRLTQRLLFQKPFRGTLDFLNLWPSEPSKWREPHKSTTIVEFATNAPFRGSQFGGALESSKLPQILLFFRSHVRATWILGFCNRSHRYEWEAYKSTKIADFAKNNLSVAIPEERELSRIDRSPDNECNETSI